MLRAVFVEANRNDRPEIDRRPRPSRRAQFAQDRSSARAFARPAVELSRYAADRDLSPGLSPAQPRRKAQSVGRSLYGSAHRTILVSVAANIMLPRLRQMAETDLGEVLKVEQLCYEFPWTLGIFSDCMRVGYH